MQLRKYDQTTAACRPLPFDLSGMGDPARSLRSSRHSSRGHGGRQLINSSQGQDMGKDKGASVAKWLAHLPFTSEAAGSSLSENFLNATRTQSSREKGKSQRSAESRGFSPGTPVSSHRES